MKPESTMKSFGCILQAQLDLTHLEETSTNQVESDKKRKRGNLQVLSDTAEIFQELGPWSFLDVTLACE